jgi:hypothetical protein
MGLYLARDCAAARVGMQILHLDVTRGIVLDANARYLDKTCVTAAKTAGPETHKEGWMMFDTERNGSGAVPVVVSCRCFGLCRGTITALSGDVLRLTCQVCMVSLGDKVSLTVSVDRDGALLGLDGVVCGQGHDGFEVRLNDSTDSASRDRLRRVLDGVDETVASV